MVPVTVNYERLFDIRHLATEMVSGVVKDFNFLEIYNLVRKEKNGRLGKIFIRYQNPIDLREYIQTTFKDLISYKNIDEIGLRLSEKFHDIEQQYSPVNLNMVVSTLIL